MAAIPEMGVRVINHHISLAWSGYGDVLDTVAILCCTSAKSVILHIDCFVYSVGFSQTIVLYCIVCYSAHSKSGLQIRAFAAHITLHFNSKVYIIMYIIVYYASVVHYTLFYIFDVLNHGLWYVATRQLIPKK